MDLIFKTYDRKLSLCWLLENSIFLKGVIFMCIKVINDVNVNVNVDTIHIDEVNAWNSDYTSYYPDYLFNILKFSIKEIGVTVPINLVQKDNQWYCVDGLRRLDVVKQLKESNEWTHEYIPATVHSLENIEDTYAACAFQKKELSISQKAFFAAKWHYEDVKKLAEENKKLNDEGKRVTKKINTSLTVAQRVGIKTPDHISKAHKLLQYDSWFYECVYQKGFNFPATDVKQLLGLLNDPNKKSIGLAIIEKMKTLAAIDDPTVDNKNLYQSAYDTINANQTIPQNKKTSKSKSSSANDSTAENNSDQNNAPASQSIKNMIAQNNQKIVKPVKKVQLSHYNLSQDELNGFIEYCKITNLNPIIKKVDSLDDLNNKSDITTSVSEEGE